MEVHNIITIEKEIEGYHLENVESFVALDIGIDQAKVYEKAKEAFVTAIEQYCDETLTFRVANTYIDDGVYENDEVIIYFKTSNDAS